MGGSTGRRLQSSLLNQKDLQTIPQCSRDTSREVWLLSAALYSTSIYPGSGMQDRDSRAGIARL